MIKLLPRGNIMTKKLESYVNSGYDVYKKIYKYVSTPNRQAAAYKVTLALSIVLLLLTTAYAGLRANIAYSTDSNAIVSAQLFDKSAKTPIVVPGPHSNLLVDPLFFIQGHLPYHYTSFTLGNVSLVLITMIAWAFLLIKLFGRKYEIPILLLLSSLILTSVMFSLSLGYTAIRNIQYPVALWFIMIVSDLLRSKRKYTRRQFWLAAIGSVLFSITLGGDSFFIYGLWVPLLAVIGWYWAQSQKFSRNMVKAVALLVAVFVGAVLMKAILSATNILDFNYAFQAQNSIIPTRSLGPSIGFALQQLLSLQGGNIFGQVLIMHNLATFVNFGLFLAGLVGLVMILVGANRSYRRKAGIADDNSFVFVTIAACYFAVFWIYVLSGYVITTLPNGQIISVENTRYISFMPLLGTVGVLWLLKNYYSKARALVAVLCAALVICMAVGFSGVNSTYKSGVQMELAPSRASIDQIIEIMRQNKVNTVLADYWYAPVLTFWSNNQFGLAAQPTCTPTSQQAQFTHIKGAKAALVIDRGGLNYAFWPCTDQQLMKLYGAPAKKLEVQGVTSNPVQIWIYN
jgi:hypothetical protein